MLLFFSGLKVLTTDCMKSLGSLRPHMASLTLAGWQKTPVKMLFSLVFRERKYFLQITKHQDLGAGDIMTSF